MVAPLLHKHPSATTYLLHEDIQDVLFDEDAIRQGVDRVAQSVTEAYAGRQFTVVAVLRGSCVFVADLIRRIPIPLELSFVGARSYGRDTTPGPVEIDLFPAGAELEGRSILLVDDILDTGKTIHRVRSELLGRGAADVRSCVFLDKPARRAVPFQADWRVFEVEDLFVVGYGLDYAGRYRNLPYVGSLRGDLCRGEPAGRGGERGTAP